jgi:hypothetical protein
MFGEEYKSWSSSLCSFEELQDLLICSYRVVTITNKNMYTALLRSAWYLTFAFFFLDSFPFPPILSFHFFILYSTEAFCTYSVNVSGFSLSNLWWEKTNYPSQQQSDNQIMPFHNSVLHWPEYNRGSLSKIYLNEQACFLDRSTGIRGWNPRKWQESLMGLVVRLDAHNLRHGEVDGIIWLTEEYKSSYTYNFLWDP